MTQTHDRAGGPPMSAPMTPERAQLIERLRFVLSPDGPDTVILTKDTVAAAAAALAAEHEARVSAEAAQALVLERAAKEADRAWANGYNAEDHILALAPDAGVEALAALRAERANIVSHATMGRTDGVGLGLNEICVQITALRNELYLDGKARGAEAAEAERDTLAAQVEALRAAGQGRVIGAFAVATHEFAEKMRAFGLSVSAGQSDDVDLDFIFGVRKGDKLVGAASFYLDGTWSCFLEIGGRTFREDAVNWWSMPDGLAEALAALEASHG